MNINLKKISALIISIMTIVSATSLFYIKHAIEEKDSIVLKKKTEIEKIKKEIIALEIEYSREINPEKIILLTEKHLK
ncbi:hypothetical protein GUI12_02425 [Anaplasmataceae bacterium AB001_6]|nr:hypothetical protein GUI12_02425 [Anaplasmataceae bacterium AB001_6]